MKANIQNRTIAIRIREDELHAFDSMRTRIQNNSMFRLLPQRSHIIRMLMRQWVKDQKKQFPR